MPTFLKADPTRAEAVGFRNVDGVELAGLLYGPSGAAAIDRRPVVALCRPTAASRSRRCRTTVNDSPTPDTPRVVLAGRVR
jgi:hypothetical protein